MLTSLQEQRPTERQPELVYVSHQPPKEYAEMFADYGDVLTPKEVAEILQVSAATVRRLIREHELPGVKVSKHLYVTKRDLIEVMTGGAQNDRGGLAREGGD